MGFESLNRLWEGVRETSHDFRVSTQVFPSVDVERLAKTLDLVNHAKTNGEENRPATEPDVLDEVEAKVIETVEADKQAAHQLLEDQFQVFADRLNNLDFEGRFGQIRTAVVSSVADFKAEVARGLDELHPLRKRLDEAQREKVAFKKRHGIDRAARVQSRAAKFLKIAVLVLVLVLESFFNGVYLSQGSEQGLVGGFMEAFGFSSVNVGFAFIFAVFCVRQIAHRSWFRKLLGAISVLAYFGIAGVLNLALAHYRDASSETFVQASKEVITRLQTAPLELADFNSWILFGVGFLFSLTAFIDSYFLADPYPGFGGVESRERAAQDSYIDQKNYLIDRLKEIRDDHNDKVDDIIKDLSKRRQEHSAIIGNRARMVELFMAYQNQLEAVANTLLKIYRSANTKARTDSPPGHFRESYPMPRINPGSSLPGEWNDGELAATIKTTQAELSDQIKLVGAEFQAAVASYHQLDTLFPDAANG